MCVSVARRRHPREAGDAALCLGSAVVDEHGDVKSDCILLAMQSKTRRLASSSSSSEVGTLWESTACKSSPCPASQTHRAACCQSLLLAALAAIKIECTQHTCGFCESGHRGAHSVQRTSLCCGARRHLRAMDGHPLLHHAPPRKWRACSGRVRHACTELDEVKCAAVIPC